MTTPREFVDRAPLIMEIHVSLSYRRRRLPEIERCGSADLEADDHEPAAAEITRGRICHGKRKSRSHRRVDRVAALSQDLDSRFGRVDLSRYHHAVRC